MNSFDFSPGLCRLGIESYLALGYEYACRGLYLHAALVLEQPNQTMIRYIWKPHHACDLMVRIREDYCNRSARLNGYPSFVHFIARDGDAAIYGKYNNLSARNLL